MSKKNDILLKSSRHIVLIAIMSATLVAGKFALSFIPNVEIVTTLLIVYAFVFGLKDALPACMIFCTLDILLYPPSLDVIISYYIYWDLLVIIVCIFKLLGAKKDYVYLIIGLVMTFIFGFITSFFTFLIFNIPFLPMYLAGIPFYAAQIASTLVFMLIGFSPLVKLLTKLKNNYNRSQEK